MRPGRSIAPFVALLLGFACSGSSAAKDPPAEGTTAAAAAKGAGDVYVFTRVAEPREHAFTILAPKGWRTEGGIFRVDPTAQGGPAQSIAAKLDFALKNDDAGSVEIRWLPDVLFFDMSQSPAGQMGLFPPGSNYQGMTVMPKQPAGPFLADVAFPYAHPQAANVRVVERKSLPDLARRYREGAAALMPGMTFGYDAAILTVRYEEGGRAYEEKMVGVVEDWGQVGAGMWGNKQTFLVRTPVGDFARWEPVMGVIQNSVRIDPKWLQGEIRGQAQRGQIAVQTQQEIERIGREITEHRAKTNAEIHNDMFLTLMEQEEYVNPYTNEVETGSNQWKYRWVNESEEVIYTDREAYDPNTDIDLNRSDFKRTPVRRRGP